MVARLPALRNRPRISPGSDAATLSANGMNCLLTAALSPNEKKRGDRQRKSLRA
jgi:hypothetical protein